MEAPINPFDPKTVILAKHAQHVALIHFPIALYISAVLFRSLARWTGSLTMAEAAYYNLSCSALCLFPGLITGVLAWQLQLEGQKLHGALAPCVIGMRLHWDDPGGLVDSPPRANAQNGAAL